MNETSMLESMGYKKMEVSFYGADCIVFKKEQNKNGMLYVSKIYFDIIAKTFNVIDEVDDEMMDFDIDMELLKGIYEQCRKMGWL